VWVVVLDGEGGVQVMGRSQLHPGWHLRCSELFSTC